MSPRPLIAALVLGCLFATFSSAYGHGPGMGGFSGGAIGTHGGFVLLVTERMAHLAGARQRTVARARSTYRSASRPLSRADPSVQRATPPFWPRAISRGSASFRL